MLFRSQRHRLLADMAEKSTDMISRHTPGDWKFIYASPAVEHLLGYKLEEIIGVPAYELYHPDDVENFKSRSASVQYSKGLYTHTYRFKCKDGRYTWLESTSRSMRDPVSGVLREILVVSRDVTQRIEADIANRRLVRILKSTSDLVLFFDTQLQVVDCNESAARTLALSGLEEHSVCLQSLFTDASYNTILSEALDIAEQVGSWQGELTMKSECGMFPVHLEVLAHYHLDNLEHYSIVARNLKAVKETEAQLKHYKSEVDHYSRLITMGVLASSLAHELNQPLTGIFNYLRGIELRFKGESIHWDDIALPVTNASKAAMRAGSIIHQMMSFTKKRPAELECIEIASLLNEVLELVHYNANKANVELITLLPDHEIFVNLDRVQLEQVLINLIINAIEASEVEPLQDVKPVYICVELKGELLVVTVEDRGKGLSKVHIEKVFQQFYSTKTSGLGMGLAISKSLIEEMGGELWAGNNENTEGAFFSFSLHVSNR